MYVYIKSEPTLYTVGHYDPAGQWHADSDHDDSETAAARVRHLNGGSSERGLLAELAAIREKAATPTADYAHARELLRQVRAMVQTALTKVKE